MVARAGPAVGIQVAIRVAECEEEGRLVGASVETRGAAAMVVLMGSVVIAEGGDCTLLAVPVGEARQVGAITGASKEAVYLAQEKLAVVAVVVVVMVTQGVAEAAAAEA